MKIHCVSCGHKLEIDDAYADFEGQIKCWVCEALLEMKAEDGMVKSVRLAQTEIKST